MGLFGLINYENYLINSLVTSSYAKNGLMILITYIITGLVRFHISTFLCTIFNSGTWFDVITPIIITVLLSLASDNMYQYVKTHKKSYERLVDYIITNYSINNFIRWKRHVSIVIGIYITLALYLIEINNYYILLTIAQTAISFVICDMLESNIPQSFVWRVLRRWKKEPTAEEFGMVDGFYFPPRSIQLASFREMEQTLQDEKVVKQITQVSKAHLISTNVISIISEYIPEKLPTPPTRVVNILPLTISLHSTEIIEQIIDKPLTPPTVRRR